MALSAPAAVKALVMLVVAAGLTAGCASTVDHRPLSRQEFDRTDFSALAPERWWGDEAPSNLEEYLKAQAPLLRKRFPDSVDATPETAPWDSALVISGGGANGAFGAGLLAGWTESGQRPDFEYVTGVSTGAMIAVFAFLGPDYDRLLVKAYSSITRDQVYRSNGWAGALFGSALSDTTPLKQLVASYVTPDIVEAIAEQSRLGRHLAIVTTHFDALRPMVWDIGAIANGRGARAVPLIRQIILASAAIPVFFPPVPIEWEVDGKSFTELHVDGGVSLNVFAYPAQIRADRLNEILGLTFRRRIFVILNGNTRSTYEPAPVKVAPIAKRTMEGVVLNQSSGDVERIYHLAQRDGIGFKMISIPETFRADRPTEFDPDYMRALMELGREIGRRGDFWYGRPPALR